MTHASDLTPTGYTLLDSGHGRKLEDLGGVRLIRPEPQALWAPALGAADWAQAAATFAPKKEADDGADESTDGAGKWQQHSTVPDKWLCAHDATQYWARLTPFRHLGCFPDQAPQWAWLRQVVQPQACVLNLFGYSGVASVVAAQAGAQVTHVDASKKALQFGKENADLNSISTIRWLLDDARDFVAREVRRGSTYDIILLDPPKYGRGPNGEKWDFMTDLPALLHGCAALLPRAENRPARGAHLWLTAYALRASSAALASTLQAFLPAGEVVTGDFTSTDGAGRAWSNAFWARWTARS
jgi:23S rRNA (cytosine1962-C5)-methyltransferase